MHENIEPGSREFINRLANQKSLFSQEELQSVLELTTRQGVSLDDWHIYGQPADVDGIAGTFRVTPEALQPVIESLIKSTKLKLEIFPFGIVAPDHFQVNVLSKWR